MLFARTTGQTPKNDYEYKRFTTVATFRGSYVAHTRATSGMLSCVFFDLVAVSPTQTSVRYTMYINSTTVLNNVTHILTHAALPEGVHRHVIPLSRLTSGVYEYGFSILTIVPTITFTTIVTGRATYPTGFSALGALTVYYYERVGPFKEPWRRHDIDVPQEELGRAEVPLNATPGSNSMRDTYWYSYAYDTPGALFSKTVTIPFSQPYNISSPLLLAYELDTVNGVLKKFIVASIPAVHSPHYNTFYARPGTYPINQILGEYYYTKP